MVCDNRRIGKFFYSSIVTKSAPILIENRAVKAPPGIIFPAEWSLRFSQPAHDLIAVSGGSRASFSEIKGANQRLIREKIFHGIGKATKTTVQVVQEKLLGEIDRPSDARSDFSNVKFRWRAVIGTSRAKGGQ